MNLPQQPLAASITDIDELRFYQTARDEFRLREDALTLIIQLNQLIKAVQKHRGMTMALIGGNREFRVDFAALQMQLDRRVLTLRVFIHASRGLVSEEQEEGLCLSWNTIRQDWQEDKLSDNFELHSHLIEQLQAIVYRLARELENPMSGLKEPVDSAYPQVFKQIELLNLVARELPEIIEQTAKIRGLSTYIAASGEADYSHDRKLRYLLKQSKQQHEKVRLQSERLHTLLNGAISSLPDIQTVELKLIYLLDTVEKDVLGGGEITTNSVHLFTLATELIDVYWEVVNQGLLVVRSWNEEFLEAWLKQSGA